MDAPQIQTRIFNWASVIVFALIASNVSAMHRNGDDHHRPDDANTQPSRELISKAKDANHRKPDNKNADPLQGVPGVSPATTSAAEARCVSNRHARPAFCKANKLQTFP